MTPILLECTQVTALGRNKFRIAFMPMFPPGLDVKALPVVIKSDMPAIPGERYELMLCGPFVRSDGTCPRCVNTLESFLSPNPALAGLTLSQQHELVNQVIRDQKKEE